MRFLCTASFLLFTTFLLAQNSTTLSTQIDDRLLVKYELKYLQQLQERHPVLLQRLNYYLDHAWYVTDYPTKKNSSKLPVVNIAHQKDINILALEQAQRIHRDPKKQTVYRIANTAQVLVYHSAEKFNKKFNQLRQQQK
ncbi:MAG: hypothetical protein AAGK47_07030 [Bacteroidota bacterium]